MCCTCHNSLEVTESHWKSLETLKWMTLAPTPKPQQTEQHLHGFLPLCGVLGRMATCEHVCCTCHNSLEVTGSHWKSLETLKWMTLAPTPKPQQTEQHLYGFLPSCGALGRMARCEHVCCTFHNSLEVTGSHWKSLDIPFLPASSASAHRPQGSV